MIFSGGSVHEDIPLVLASLSVGRPELICELIEDADANEFVRSSAVEPLLCLLREGELSRAGVVGYFRELMEQRLERVLSTRIYSSRKDKNETSG